MGRALSPQEVIVTLQYLAYVKSVVLLHLLLHQVFHNARIEGLAGLFTGHVVLLRVVKHGLAALVFDVVLLVVACELHRIGALLRAFHAMLNLTQRWQGLVAPVAWLAYEGHLVDDDDLGQLGSVLEALEFCIQ